MYLDLRILSFIAIFSLIAWFSYFFAAALKLYHAEIREINNRFEYHNIVHETILEETPSDLESDQSTKTTDESEDQYEESISGEWEAESTLAPPEENQVLSIDGNFQN